MKHSMEPKRIARIARAAHLTYETAAEYILADWDEGQEHQDWLDTANDGQIVNWLFAVVPEEETQLD